LLMNALNKYDNRSPRERFWSNQRTWPDDTPDHEFVGRLILRAGAIMAGTEWNDLDPAVSIPMPLSEDLNIYTPPPQIQQAAFALTMGDRPFRERPPMGLLGGSPDIPSKADWSIARKIVANQISVAQAKYNRFLRACFAVEAALKSGTLKTATRPYAGGQLTAQPQHFWYTEFSWTRFETCRVNPDNLFDVTPAEFGGLWIFVEKDKEASEVPVEITQSPQRSDVQIAEIVRGKPSPRGRKSKSAWDDLFSEFLRIVHVEGVPDSPNISQMARRLADWGSEEGLPDMPEPKTIEAKLRTWLKRLQTVE